MDGTARFGAGNGRWKLTLVLAALAVTCLAVTASAHTDSEEHGTLTLHDSSEGEPRTGTEVGASADLSCTIWVRGYGLDHHNGTIEAEHGTLLDVHAHAKAEFETTADGNFEVGPFTLHEGGDDWTVWATVDGHGTEEHAISYEVCEEEPTPPPECPRGLQLDVHAATEVELRWNASERADKFIVYRADPGERFHEVAEVESTRYVDTEVEANATVEFRVTALDSHGESKDCPALEVRTPAIEPPDCPSNLQVHLTTTGVAALTWNASAEAHADAFLVLRSTDGEGFEQLARVDATAFVDANLRLGAHHAYRVVAVNAAGQAEGCPLVELEPPSKSPPDGEDGAPACPGNLQAHALQSGEIRLTWDASSSAETYNVYRASESSAFQKTAETDTTGYVDADTEVDETYEYRVTAENEAGESKACPTVEATAIPFFGGPLFVSLAALGSLGLVTVVRRDR